MAKIYPKILGRGANQIGKTKCYVKVFKIPPKNFKNSNIFADFQLFSPFLLLFNIIWWEFTSKIEIERGNVPLAPPVPETFEWILPELAVLNSKNGKIFNRHFLLKI